MRTMRVMMNSLIEYTPDDVVIYLNDSVSHYDLVTSHRDIRQSSHNGGSYGADYNFIARSAFKEHDTIIICNDDVVFNPTTFQKLQEDFNRIEEGIGRDKIGWVGCLTDYAIGSQNIRKEIENVEDGEFHAGKIKRDRESYIFESKFIAPICAAVTKEAWIDYLPINYFSDNIQCRMMSAIGLRHFISRSYIHHVGSQSIGKPEEEFAMALGILQEDYPLEYNWVLSSISDQED